ncbi:MAG TPA: serine hydrolase, partial [Gemmatimonadales bacterium]|nr:serine hydrolase [Gemmatimonadales bacterium]
RRSSARRPVRAPPPPPVTRSMPMMPRRIPAAILALALLPPTALQAQQAPKELDAYVRSTLKLFDQPGAAIAVVQDGRVVFQQGWGVRRLGSPEPVDAHTRFQIASNTKAMTTAALALLVEDGKLGWDDRVVDHLPWFALGGDPYVTHEFRVRDLLCHRSGLSLGAGDLLWFHSTYTSAEIARRLRFIAPATSFRSAYAYDNVLFIVAGELVEAVSGMPWADFLQQRLFQPLGMQETATSITGVRLDDNVATPHGRIPDTMQVVPYDSILNGLSAGGVLSSVADMSRWLRVQLDSGRIDADHRLWPAAETRTMWQPQIDIPTSPPPPGLKPLGANFSTYALGWRVRDYRGLKLVTHTGGLAGMLSEVFLVPEKRLGVVVLTNGETLAFHALAYRVLDYYLHAPRFDWPAGYAALAARSTSGDSAFVDSATAARHGDAGPSLPLAGYAGRYHDDWYGDVNLAVEDGHLVLHWSHSPALTADLEHWQYDTFRARMRVPNVADAFVTFALGYDGRVDRMTLVPFLPSTDFSFNYQDLLFRPVP